MKLLLQLKHWQLFLLMFAIPFGLQLLVMMQMAFADDFITLIDRMPAVLTLFIAALVLYTLVYFGWWWTMGTSLYARLPAGATLNITLFKGLQAFAAIYLILLYVGIGYLMRNFLTQFDQGAGFDPVIVPAQAVDSMKWFLLVIPFHFFAIFSMFYGIYFVAKALKTVELQREAEIGDYMAEFVLIWFFFLGVWFIQPRINALFRENPTDAGDHLIGT